MGKLALRHVFGSRMVVRGMEIMPGEYETHRYEFLDALRGVAAILVVQRHVSETFGGHPFASSYLAVDFFFVLSGFVIAHAYDRKLTAGMSVRSFLLRRLIRLYPMFIFGLVLMTGFKFLQIGQDAQGTAVAWAVTFLFNAAFLPISFLASPFILGPAWSLFCEAIANIVYAPVATMRTSSRTMAAFAILGAVGVIASALTFRSLDVGWEFSSIHAGVARVFFSFFVGVIIYRQRGRMPQTGVPSALLSFVALVALLCVDVPDVARAYYDLVVVLLALPLIVVVGSSVSLGARAGPVCRFLGAASYPVYVLHLPLALIAVWLLTMMGISLSAFISAAIWIFVGAVTVMAWVLDVYADGPLRRKILLRLLSDPKSQALNVSQKV